MPHPAKQIMARVEVVTREMAMPVSVFCDALIPISTANTMAVKPGSIQPRKPHRQIG
jgi:hypothetical protein